MSTKNLNDQIKQSIDTIFEELKIKTNDLTKTARKTLSALLPNIAAVASEDEIRMIIEILETSGGDIEASLAEINSRLEVIDNQKQETLNEAMAIRLTGEEKSKILVNEALEILQTSSARASALTVEAFSNNKKAAKLYRIRVYFENKLNTEE